MFFKRLHTVELGTTRALRTGQSLVLADPYYFVMELSWPAFVGLVCAAFAAINLCFGLVYTLLPGAVANAAPGSLIDGIFFSIDTLGTVGYGFMYPATHLAHVIAAVEILLGIFFSATVTGLVFARFARPRVGLCFSRCAVIGRHGGRPALMVRVASLRSRPLADADAQLSWLQTVHGEHGKTTRRLTDLALVRNRNPMLGLAWTLIHELPDDSEMLAALAGPERFMITAMVRGTDTLLAGTTIGNASYGRDDVLRDHEFVDILSNQGETLVLDMDRLHETRPLAGAGAAAPGGDGAADPAN